MSGEIISAEPTYRGWSTLLLAKIRLPDGCIITREIEDHGSAACVLPYDPSRKTAIVIRQTRAPLLYKAAQDDLIEAIAGVIEASEAADVGARREAEEEAGLRLSALEHVSTAWTMPGISTEQMALFLAQYSAPDRIGAGGGVDDERIEVIEIGLPALAAMADAAELTDMKTLVLVQTLRLKRPELFDR